MCALIVVTVLVNCKVRYLNSIPCRPYLIIFKWMLGLGCSSVSEALPSMYKALGSILSTTCIYIIKVNTVKSLQRFLGNIYNPTYVNNICMLCNILTVWGLGKRIQILLFFTLLARFAAWPGLHTYRTLKAKKEWFLHLFCILSSCRRYLHCATNYRTKHSALKNKSDRIQRVICVLDRLHATSKSLE